MSEHPNAKLVRRGYESFTHGDLAAMRELMADNVIWHQPGHSRFAGDYQGQAAVLGLLEGLRLSSEGTFKVDVVDVLASPERAVVMQEETAWRKGRRLDTASAVEFEIHHGRITEATVYPADEYKFDEFWA